MTDLGIEVPMQVERAAQVIHGELTITENVTKIFPNSECVICQCPKLFESQIVLNTRGFRLRYESVSQHVHVLINRTIKVVWFEQSIFETVKDNFPFPQNKAVYPRNRTRRSLIYNLVYGTFMTKKTFPLFGIVLIVWIGLAHAYRSQFYFITFISWMNTGRWSCKFKWIFTSLYSVERGMSSSICGWRVTSQKFPRPIPTGTGLFYDILVLDFYFKFPFAKFLCSSRSNVFFGGFLGRIIFGKFPKHVSLSSLFVAARFQRHWQHSVVQMCICSCHSWFRSY